MVLGNSRADADPRLGGGAAKRVYSALHILTPEIPEDDPESRLWIADARRGPSETAEFLITRVLAYCLEYTEGIEFSKGLSDPDEPTIAVRDLTGALQTWIDIGLPEAARIAFADARVRKKMMGLYRNQSHLGRFSFTDTSSLRTSVGKRGTRGRLLSR